MEWKEELEEGRSPTIGMAANISYGRQWAQSFTWTISVKPHFPDKETHGLRKVWRITRVTSKQARSRADTWTQAMGLWALNCGLYTAPQRQKENPKKVMEWKTKEKNVPRKGRTGSARTIGQSSGKMEKGPLDLATRRSSVAVKAWLEDTRVRGRASLWTPILQTGFFFFNT